MVEAPLLANSAAQNGPRERAGVAAIPLANFTMSRYVCVEAVVIAPASPGDIN
jgi:hypothetical protein